MMVYSGVNSSSEQALPSQLLGEVPLTQSYGEPKTKDLQWVIAIVKDENYERPIFIKLFNSKFVKCTNYETITNEIIKWSHIEINHD